MKFKNIKIINLSTVLTILLTISTALLCTSCVKENKTVDKNINSQLDIQNNSVINKESENKINTAKLTFTGDIMVHSYQYNEAYNKNTNTYDFLHNFEDIKKYFDNSNYVIGNLETTFGGEVRDYPMFSTPDSFLDALKYAGFDLLTTANNHCLDSGSDGLIRTINKLNEYNINHTGTYKTEEESKNIFIENINGINVAFLAYTYGTNGIPIKYQYMVNIIDTTTEEKIKSDIQKARELSDLVIVLPHIGIEYQQQPNDYVKNYVNNMFEWGADIIVASHPHVLQPMEYKIIKDSNGTERKCFVMYSMGNFISSQTTPPRNASIILNIDIKKIGNNKATIENVSFIPIWTQFRNINNNDHFVVRSIYEILTLPIEEQKNMLRQKDINRINDIHYETTKILLNKDIPIEEIKNEYLFE